MQKKTSKEKKFFETLDEYLSFVKVNKSPKEYLFENTVINKMVKGCG
jgi:hypothetical protein